MDTLRQPAAAHRVADDPTGGIARRHRPSADELLTFLQRNVGNLTGRRVELVERAIGPRILLDRIQEPVPGRLDARRLVGVADA